MTAPDIRAQAIEALKAHQPHEDVYLYCTCGVQLADDGFPAHVVDALAEAGLLPTEVEERTSRTWGQAKPVSRRRRYVTEWREAQR